MMAIKFNLFFWNEEDFFLFSLILIFYNYLESKDEIFLKFVRKSINIPSKYTSLK